MNRLAIPTEYLPSLDEIRSAIGLRRQSDLAETIASAIGVFAAGVLVGAGLALLFAPKPGEEFRQQLRRGFGDRIGKLRDNASRAAGQAI